MNDFTKFHLNESLNKSLKNNASWWTNFMGADEGKKNKLIQQRNFKKNA